MNMNNLMDNVRDFFIEQYQGVENSNSFLSFEALGSIIDPEDFNAESDELSEIKSREQLSILGDRLPEIDDIFFANTSRLSSVYEELIESAVFTGERIKAEDKGPYIAKFSEVKEESIFKFNEGIKASISMPEGDYLPVYGSPKKWYDPSGSFWATKSFSVSEKKNDTPPKSPKVTKKPMPLVWRTKLVANTQHLNTVKAPALKLSPIKLQNIQVAAVKSPQPKVAHSVSAVKFSRPVAVTGSPVIKSKAVAHSGATKVASPTIKTNQLSEWKNLNVLKHLNVAERIKLTGHIAKNDTAKTEPVRSNGFSMSFDYCIVNLERPWFETSLFHYTNMWYCLSLQGNYFSTGAKDQSNTGMLKCITTAMILVKDLKITAAWTDEDKRNAENSLGLGVFNLSESTFQENELSNPGIQIIGWMCEVLPQLPVLADPNIVN